VVGLSPVVADAGAVLVASPCQPAQSVEVVVDWVMRWRPAPGTDTPQEFDLRLSYQGLLSSQAMVKRLSADSTKCPFEESSWRARLRRRPRRLPGWAPTTASRTYSNACWDSPPRDASRPGPKMTWTGDEGR